MNELRTISGTIDELKQGIEDLSPREQAVVLGLVDRVEKIGRKTDFSRAEVQEVLGRVFVYKERGVQYERAASGLFDDLLDAGLPVDKISELEQEGIGDSRAVGPLLKWLDRTQNHILMHHIAVALGCDWAGDEGIEGLLTKFANLNEQNDPGPNSVRVTIVAALEKHANSVGTETFLEIATDPANGFARSRAIRALTKFPKQKETLVPRLLDFLTSDDSDQYFESALLLGRWKVAQARARIQELIDTADERYLANSEKTLEPNFERDELRKALWKIPPSNPH